LADLTCRVSSQDSALLSCVSDVARATQRPVRATLLQGLLQLPRIADERGIVSMPSALSTLNELAYELPPGEEWVVRGVPTSPRELIFHPVQNNVARDVMNRFHYLRSSRSDGRAYGLHTHAGDLVAIAVTSPLDVPRIEELLRKAGGPTQGVRVVSRVFAFESSPRNAISFLLSRVLNVERSQGTTELVTYVNPNMGFAGASYRASGWKLLGDEPGTTYRYLDGRYITDRMLRHRFGSALDGEDLARRLEISKMPLAPLLIFGSAKAREGAVI
jgi:hypothetical protein